MKQVYDNVNLTYGAHEGGLCKIEAAPIEWLTEKLSTEFSTGAVYEPSLIEGKEWMVFEFTPDSYLFNEAPATSKAGGYHQTEISGQVNDISKESLQLMETLRYHQFIVKATDFKKRLRICGDSNAGMILQIADENKNTSGGKLSVALVFTMEHEKKCPFSATICAGVENFTEVDATVPDVIPATSLSLNFSGGNIVGKTEVQLVNLPGATHNFLLDAGDSNMNGNSSYWAAYISAATFKIRWRRRCAGGRFSDWLEATFNNPFD